ncbi:MAG: transposase [Candidatus Omnitrophica bacterium]|nr:transposase [Candidatus Omnitrophota bacterium]
MPRKPRELVNEGIYHLFNRGNDRRNLFQEAPDFHHFLSLLLQAAKKYPSEIFHYCLMTNHFHLLVRIARGEDLPPFMHLVQLGYARYFKKKYGFVGHVFQERFRSPRIPEESYYLQCGRYIERNPVSARLVKDPWDYPYSSAPFYASGETDPLVTPNLYYEGMATDSEERRRRYREFLSAEEPYAGMIDKALVKV